MFGFKHLQKSLQRTALIAGENPCGWSDATLDMLASAIDAMTSEKTKAGVSLHQVADYYKVTIRTIQRWRIENSDFPQPLDPYSKTLMFPTDKIVEWKMNHLTLF